MVIALNTRTILSIFRDMKELRYMEVGWGDDEAVQLAEVLPLCTSATKLNLVDNKIISDRGAKALAAPRARRRLPIGDEGAMPKLEKLNLYYNQIGDEGAVALAEAVGKGALPELKQLNLERNKLSQTAKDAWEAVEAKRSGLSVYGCKERSGFEEWLRKMSVSALTTARNFDDVDVRDPRWRL